MTVYRVMIAGEGLRMKLDGEEADCGFYKNIYVWAGDKTTAIAKAKTRVWNDLKNTSATIKSPKNSDPSGLSIRVEEIEAGLSFFALRKRLGFVFHKMDAARKA